jgi:hypothetical protein
MWRADPLGVGVLVAQHANEGNPHTPLEVTMMFAANTYVIREATDEDAWVVRALAALDSQAPLSGAVLIGELSGAPAAAVSVSDGRVLADPFQPTANLVAQLRMRAMVLQAFEQTPSLPARIRAGVRIRGLASPARV